jgi:thioredoxin
MKIQKKNFVLLFAVMMTLTLSCGNSNTSNVIVEDPMTDDYDALRNPNQAPQKITEDLSGRVITLSQQEFIERITDINNPKGFQYKGQTPCVVDFYASWCKPCGFLSENLRNIAPEYQGKVIFYKVDIDKAYDVAAAFGVKSIPMLLYFKPRGEISSTVGYLTVEELRKAIDEFLLNP